MPTDEVAALVEGMYGGTAGADEQLLASAEAISLDAEGLPLGAGPTVPTPASSMEYQQQQQQQQQQ